MQVSPAEIEVALLDHPDHLIIDAAVAGVTLKDMGGHDTKVPRAWVVLSPRGQKMGKKRVAEELDAWTKKTLSRYKWLKGGIGFVNEVRHLPHAPSSTCRHGELYFSLRFPNL
jgi:acyl-coenzyme A synthetase/AMP-(fatty) acid ligase